MFDDKPAAQDIPFSLEAEQAFLGACLFDNEVYHKTKGNLSPEKFYDPVHGLIYETIAKIADSGQPASPITVGRYLKNSELFEQVGGGDYLVDITKSVPGTFAAGDYSALIADMWVRREVIRFADDASFRARNADFDDSGKVILEGIQSDLFTLATDVDPASAPSNTAQQVDDWFKGIVARCENDGLPGLSTGLTDLNDATGGYQGGMLYIAACRPGMGKSIFGLTAAEGVLGDGHSVYFHSAEMPQRQLRSRMASSILFNRERNVPYRDMDNGAIKPDDLKRLENVACDLLSVPLHIDDRTGKTASDVAATAKRWARIEQQRGRKPGLIVVDYLGRLKGEPGLQNKVQIEGEKAKIFKNLALELDLPVLALCQLNRGLESRDDKRPMLSDLRDSGEIEQEADAVMMLYRPMEYLRRHEAADPAHDDHGQWVVDVQDKKNRLEVLVEKNRHGPKVNVDCFIEPGCAAIRDRAPYWFHGGRP